LSKCLADDFGDGDSLSLCSPCEAFLEVWVKPDRLDRRWSVAEAGTASLASAGEDLVDVIASFGFVGQRVDELVVDGLA
jgi:hypothetical protein